MESHSGEAVEAQGWRRRDNSRPWRRRGSARSHLQGAGSALRYARVAGALEGATIRVVGDIGSFCAGVMRRSAFSAGIDLAHVGETLLGDPADFTAAQVSIEKSTIAGTRGCSEALSEQSQVAAWKITRAQMSEVAHGGTTDFGFAARTILSLTETTAGTRTGGRFDAPGEERRNGDFVARAV